MAFSSSFSDAASWTLIPFLKSSAHHAETREQLEPLEGERKAIRLKAKHCRLSFRSLLHFTGTVTPRIFTNSLTWVSLSTYIAWRVVFFNWAPAASETYITLGDLSPLISFVVFIFVFLNSNLYARFYDQYNMSMSLEGRIFDICLLARSFLPKEYSFRIWRRINAAHCLGYVGLTQGRVFSKENYLDSLLNGHSLLTEPEKARIDQVNVTHGGTAYREVLAWIIQDLKEYINSLSECRDRALIFSEVSVVKELIQQVLTFRGKMGGIFDYADMPLPLIYTHLVVVIAWTFLPLYCFAVASNVHGITGNNYSPSSSTASAAIAEILPALCVILMIIFVVGTRLVGDALADPYGKYLEDLTILQYSTFTVMASRKILMANKFDQTSLDDELELESRRPQLGPAWFALPPFAGEDKVASPAGMVNVLVTSSPLLSPAKISYDLSQREAILQEFAQEGLGSFESTN